MTCCQLKDCLKSKVEELLDGGHIGMFVRKQLNSEPQLIGRYKW
jgi:hypothetical protein